ncbi:MAG: hypothetical protein ACFFDW_12635 [Candidatus Thorarchaeota archaeon]
MISKTVKRKSKIAVISVLISMLLILMINVAGGVIDTEPPTISNIGHYPENPTNTDSILINCTVVDITGISEVSLYYCINGSNWYDDNMNQVGVTDNFEYYLNSLTYNVLFEYYIVAIDSSASFNTAVDDNGGEYYSFTVGLNDIDGPEITDVSFLPTTPNNNEIVTINCTVIDDFSGIAAVTLYYRENGSQWSTQLFDHISGDEYQIEIGPFEANLVIEFYINATDDSTNANIGINDNLGSYFSFNVIPITTEASPLCSIISIVAIGAVSLVYKRRK